MLPKKTQTDVRFEGSHADNYFVVVQVARAAPLDSLNQFRRVQNLAQTDKLFLLVLGILNVLIDGLVALHRKAPTTQGIRESSR